MKHPSPWPPRRRVPVDGDGFGLHQPRGHLPVGPRRPRGLVSSGDGIQRPAALPRIGSRPPPSPGRRLLTVTPLKYSTPRFFNSSENRDPKEGVLYYGDFLLPTLMAVISPFEGGGDFIWSHKPEPPKGGGANYLGGVTLIVYGALFGRGCPPLPLFESRANRHI